MNRLFLPALIFLVGCPPSNYGRHYMNVTKQYRPKTWVRTPKGIKVSAPPSVLTPAFLKLVDQKTDELEACLQRVGVLKGPIRRDWFGVLVPPDWYVSKCSGEQLIPSNIGYKLCEAKGITIKPECRQVWAPTEACPCPCNARAAILNNWSIVTTPNLKLFAAELTRLVLGEKWNNPWKPPVNQCLH